MVVFRYALNGCSPSRFAFPACPVSKLCGDFSPCNLGGESLRGVFSLKVPIPGRGEDAAPGRGMQPGAPA